MNPRVAARRARLVRSIRRALRVLVACVALFGVLGTAAAPAAAAVVRVIAESVHSCHCKHDDTSRKECPCCKTGEHAEGCLPAPGGSSTPATLAAHGDLVPLAALAGSAQVFEVTPLRDRLLHVRLDRPPRA